MTSVMRDVTQIRLNIVSSDTWSSFAHPSGIVIGPSVWYVGSSTAMALISIIVLMCHPSESARRSAIRAASITMHSIAWGVACAGAMTRGTCPMRIRWARRSNAATKARCSVPSVPESALSSRVASSTNIHHSPMLSNRAVGTAPGTTIPINISSVCGASSCGVRSDASLCEDRLACIALSSGESDNPVALDRSEDGSTTDSSFGESTGSATWRGRAAAHPIDSPGACVFWRENRAVCLINRKKHKKTRFKWTPTTAARWSTTGNPR